ncbi:MAG TPA: tetratricopeptide repeat protein [Vicinamibacterales bacterium]|nr:tetratricopeptide repeat protein [Vicinamibacterales bacterium]
MFAGGSVGPYQIVRQLGAGGMGVVWLAEDTRLNRKVALKTVKSAEADTTEGRQRLMREARAAAALNHPHIATVHDVLDVEGKVIVVFEYVEGESLAQRLHRGPLPINETVEIAWQLADALAAAHAQGVIHRDLKPGNVVLGPDGRAKVLDFGIARLVPAGADMSASVPGTIGVGLVGTPGYAAPEQYLSRNVDGRADLYALGVIIYEMIVGRRPFPGNDALAIATSVLRDPAPKLKDSSDTRVPPRLESLVARLLERDPHKRPPSGDEVLVELSPLRDTESSPLARRTIVLRRRVPTGAIVAGLVLVAIVIALTVRLQLNATRSGTDAPVVAVLPLSNISGDASNDYLGAGLAESLITSLASAPNVTVLSRSAVEESRQQNPDRASFVRALDATYVVTGSVQEVANRLRVTLNLERPDASVAWGRTVEGPTRDLFTLQSQLATLLSDALNQQTPSTARAEPAAPSTSSEPAQLAYWKARAHFDRQDLAGNIQAALKEFENAIALDPKFAIAYAGLAEAQWALYLQTNDRQWANRAVESTQTALQLEPERPSVLYTAALTSFRSGRYDDSLKEVDRALTLQPTYEDAMRLRARVLVRLGRIDEGLVEFNRVAAIRPNSVSLHTDMGLALYSASRYADALQSFEKAIALSPSSSVSLARAGAASQMLGENTRALDYYERANAIQPRAETFSSMGTIYYSRGDYAKAAAAYEGAVLIRPLGAITHRNLGDAYARLGRKEEALRAYRQAVKLAEGEVAVSPGDARAIARLAVYYAKAGDDAAARRSLAAAEKLAPADEQVKLRAAVVHALAGRATPALDALERAMAGGIAAREIASEEDFESLRPLPRFAAMVGNQPEEKR